MSLITFSVGDITKSTFQARVLFTPLSTPIFADDGTLVITTPRSVMTDLAGAGSITLQPGAYQISLVGVVGNSDKIFIAVPDDNATYPLRSIVTSGINSLSAAMTQSNIVNGIAAGLAGLIGGVGKLDGVTTLGVSKAVWLVYDPSYAPSFRMWFLRVGSDLQDPVAGIIVPLDHAASGKVWVAIS